VSLLGVVTASVGFLLAVFLVAARLFSQITVQGWTSVIVAVLVIGGAVLISLGVIAEYVGVAVRMAMGKPIYLIVSDPDDGPLGRRSRVGDDATG
jgi:undecaprenyl-phosphate 4-deoxy-4-formamido-L-arabinose transferase